MRSVLAAFLAALVLALAWAPHVHAGRAGAHECAACLIRQADQARSEIPDLAPVAAVWVEAEAEPDQAPPTGAPLGAIPGQSPPVNG